LPNCAQLRGVTREPAAPSRQKPADAEGAGHQILAPGGPRTVRAIGLRVPGVSGYLLSQGGTAKADAEAGVGVRRSLLEFLEAGIKGRK